MSVFLNIFRRLRCQTQRFFVASRNNTSPMVHENTATSLQRVQPSFSWLLSLHAPFSSSRHELLDREVCTPRAPPGHELSRHHELLLSSSSSRHRRYEIFTGVGVSSSPARAPSRHKLLPSPRAPPRFELLPPPRPSLGARQLPLGVKSALSFWWEALTPSVLSKSWLSERSYGGVVAVAWSREEGSETTTFEKLKK
jgi:hypothetical protein